jgi:hypothetical protein
VLLPPAARDDQTLERIAAWRRHVLPSF